MTGVMRCGFVALAVLVACQAANAQVSYQTGQNASPGYEGWELNEDGSFNLVFGYMNRNWQEELEVPVGPDNNISPGPADQGQPTHFLPRRNRYVFKVRVPADFGDQELVWTLTTQGKTEAAYGTLRLDYRLDYMVIMSETGSIGAGFTTEESRANTPPTITLVGNSVRRVSVGQPVTLVARITDDDLPRIPPTRGRSSSVMRATSVTGCPTLALRTGSPTKVIVGGVLARDASLVTPGPIAPVSEAITM